MQVIIGKQYRLDIGTKSKKEKTPWYKNPDSQLSRFSTWGDLDGALVIAKAETRLVTDYVSVILEGIPNEAFFVPKSCLMIPTVRLPRPCVCDDLDLYRYGCQCKVS